VCLGDLRDDAFDYAGLVTRTALIVGAGIGGLSAGLALRKAGWAIRIFERADSPRELGFGLALAPNAMAALRELGLAEIVRLRGHTPTRGEVRRPDGTVLKRAEIPAAGSSLGGATVIALRPALHGVLLEAVGPEVIALGSEATSFTQQGDRVTLHLAHGDRVEGDVLVGADGAHSVLRRILHPSEPPARWSRIVAVRGGVHGVVHHLGGLSGIYYIGRGIEAFLVRASDTGIYWALSLADELVPPGMRDPKAILTHMLPRFDQTFREISSATDDLRCDELVDRDPIPFWGTGIVTLLGDAAHPVLPHTGQGAAQAMVDAVTLGRVLADNGPIEPALRAYERDRRRKTARLLGQGRRTAAIMRTMNPVACAARELAVRMMPITSLLKFLVKINRRAGTDVR
jgi:2-polyprenyl-6-methoxyphenol hydroxylase-like FAD-dependent oxidoreductase